MADQWHFGKMTFAIICFIASIVYVTYIPDQGDFFQIIIPYIISFVSYLYLIRVRKYFVLFLFLAIGIRMLLLPAFPNLSDDIYRFAWDGYMTLNGINPYTSLPSDLTNNSIPFLTEELYAGLNSPHYYSIYPTVCQAIFTVGAWVAQGDIKIYSIVLKLIMILAEIGTLYFILKILGKYKHSQHKLFIYALNPLIIIEICGNLHFEGLMIFFFTLFFYLLIIEKLAWSLVPLALSIGTKLLPLIFMPFLIIYLGWKKSLKYFISLGLLLLILFLPIITQLPFFLKSVDLYFQKFEFNASIYYALRWLGVQITGYNQIHVLGPFLGIATISAVGFLCWKYQKVALQKIATYWLLAFCTYLFLATTIHPWYLSLPILLCVFSKIRFPIFWSGLIFLSYINYSYSPYFENLFVVGFEYLLVFGIAIWEYRTHLTSSTKISSVNV